MSNNPSIQIRLARPGDGETLYRFVYELATYEKESEQVKVTPEALESQLALGHPPFECLLAEEGGVPCGMALFFQNYSTWRGKPGMYLEDLFVPETYRGRGIGRLLLSALARIAVDRGYSRLDWAVLDWNTPAIEFYQQLGAKPLEEWTTFRLTGEHLVQAAREGPSISSKRSS